MSMSPPADTSRVALERRQGAACAARRHYRRAPSSHGLPGGRLPWGRYTSPLVGDLRDRRACDMP